MISVALVSLAMLLAIVVWARPRLCSSTLGTPEEIARTPRADRRIEQLAIQISKTITADQQTYDRLLRDTNTIRALVPTLRDVHYSPVDDGRGLIVKLNLVARGLLALGLYRQWDCLNRHYRLEATEPISQRGYLLLTFKGTYDMQKIASLYSRLPGVEQVEPNKLVIVGAWPTLCAARRDSIWHYVFCEETGARRLHYFSTASDGDVTLVDSWERPESAQAADATRPLWVAQYWDAEGCGLQGERR